MTKGNCLPKGWRNASIADVCLLVTDGTHHSPTTTESGDRLYITSKNVRPFNLDLGDIAYVSERVHSEIYSRCPVERGDILYVKDGANTGYAAVNTLDEPFAMLSSVALLKPNRKLLNPAYLVHWLNSDTGYKRMTQNMSGSAIRRLILAEIKSRQLPLPPLGEQTRIAAILDKANAIRRKRGHQKTSIDQLIHSAFMEIVGPKAPGSSEWNLRTIASLAANRPGSMRTGPFGSDLKHSEFVDEGIAVLGIDNAVQNCFNWVERRYITPEKYEQLQRYRVYPGDVIITILGTTGRSAVVPDDIPIAITTKHLATITLDPERAEAEFVSNAIHRHPAALRQIGGANRGAIMDGLNLGLIKSIELRVPPIEVQKGFTKAVNQIRRLDGCIQDGLEEAKALFNSLVNRAFKGEL